MCKTRSAAGGLGSLIILVILVASAYATADDVQPVFRRLDRRPRHNDARLTDLGIKAYESKRLKLYTDLPAETAAALPPVIDAAYEAWVKYFGPLLPSRDGSEFQITGYLIGDRELFRSAGLVPADLPPFVNGRHREQEFWAYEQPTEYYRRHLMIHEATHCFMSFGDFALPPWYMEGMAELFGTHIRNENGQWIFGVMPGQPEAFVGLRRIDLVRKEVREGRSLATARVCSLKSEDFTQNTDYAWCWALCKFLDTHPRYAQSFRRLGHKTSAREFENAVHAIFERDYPEIELEWSLFTHQLQWGHDIARAAIDFSTPANVEGVSVVAARGWQSSGVEVVAGQRYRIAAEGECTLGASPKPWTSEPQGISIFYSEGRPIGLLLGTVMEAEPRTADRGMLAEFVVGRATEFLPKTSGTLFLRINDRWGSLADNRGSYRVTVRPVSSSK